MNRDGSRPSTLDDAAKPYNWSKIKHWCRHGIRRRYDYHYCRLCGRACDASQLCAPCYRDLPWRRHGQLRRKFPHLDTVWACFNYRYPIRQMVHRIKFQHSLVDARILGELLTAHLPATGNHDQQQDQPSVLFPVPLAHGRLLRRGYNQACEIALVVSSITKLPMDVVSVYKQRATAPQSTLAAAARYGNMRGVFRHRRRCESIHAIIIDDVVTTGATLSAMAQTLRAAGAARVSAWVLAASSMPS